MVPSLASVGPSASTHWLTELFNGRSVFFTSRLSFCGGSWLGWLDTFGVYYAILATSVVVR